MACYQKQSNLQSLSEDSDDDHNQNVFTKRRREDDYIPNAKRFKNTSLGSMPRLSNASSTSIISTGSSEEDSESECRRSDVAYTGEYVDHGEPSRINNANGEEYIEDEFSNTIEEAIYSSSTYSDIGKLRTSNRLESNASTASSLSVSSSQSSEEESENEPGNRVAASYLDNFSSLPSQQIESYYSNDGKTENLKHMSVAERMMSSMGYSEGKGLGKFAQGIVDPIEASNQRGRRGLGFTIKGLEPIKNLKWDNTLEIIKIKEEVFWLPENCEAPPSLDTLYSWSQDGPKLKEMTGQNTFVHPEVLIKILQSKNIFDELEARELMMARSRSNPYETLGKLFFQNRAALKMANIEAVFDYMFTKPVDRSDNSLIGQEEVLYFADVCAAPGGFSEYVLWRRKQISKGFCDAKGFGFTLKTNDFKLHDFLAAPYEFFEPHYGKDGTGDIFSPENITSFCKFVMKSTNGKGVHFMMADGGFSVEGEENIQEIRSKQLYLCQFIVALGIVRENGSFVCKLFDVFTPFSVGLIYLLYRCFDKVCLHKPNSSRPANSERYIICKWRKKNVSDIYQYLYEMNIRLIGCENSTFDVSNLVALDVLKEDSTFFQYIIDSNNVFGKNQVIALEKIRCFYQDKSLREDRQTEIRAESIKFWDLPDMPRMSRQVPPPKEKIKKLLTPDESKEISSSPGELTPQTLNSLVHSRLDYRFVFINSQRDKTLERGFYLGQGGCNNVFRWNGTDGSAWSRCVNIKVELPPDTLVYGEMVTELRGESRAQRKVNSLHLIDAIWLNGFDCRPLHLSERYSLLKKFCGSINKPSRNDLLPLRCKIMHKFEEIESLLTASRLQSMIIKSSSKARRVYCDEEKTDDELARYTIPMGILMLKTVHVPWMMAYSKSQNRKYFYNTITRSASFECIKEMIASFSHSYSQGFFWWWDSGVRILESDEEDESKLSLRAVIRHIKSH